MEQKRNRVGFHINTGALEQAEAKEAGSQQSFKSEFDNDRFAATPIPNSSQSEFFKQCRTYVQLQGYRVTLSGIGGDEATGGGVPTPTPELQNLLARARFVTLSRQLKAWAAKMRKPRLPLLWEAVEGFFSARADLPKDLRPAPWLHPDFVRRNRAVFCGYPFRVKLVGPLPSFQHHLNKLEANRRFVSHCVLHSELLREARYPYYDRDFLEFAYAIPREQIVRVGQRRSLMKRALVGTLPDELLNRKRKAFIPPGQKDISSEWSDLGENSQHMVSGSAGIIDSDRFWKELQKAQRNEDIPIGRLKRTVTLEFWLRHLATQGVLTNSRATERQNYSSTLEAKRLQVPTRPQV